MEHPPSPSVLAWAPVALAGLVLAAAAVADLAHRLIPDVLPAALALLGASLRLAEGWLPFATSLSASLVLFLALAVLAVRGAIGGGDVKLAAACALFVPLVAVDDFVMATALAGGLLALGYLALGIVLRGLRRHGEQGARCQPARSVAPRGAGRLERLARAEAWRIRRGGPLPYGIAIGVGCLVASLHPNSLSTLL